MEHTKRMEHQVAMTAPARALRHVGVSRLMGHTWNTMEHQDGAGRSGDQHADRARIQPMRTRAQLSGTAELIGCDTLPRNILQRRSRYAAESTVADNHVLASMKPLRAANTRAKIACPTVEIAFIGY